MIYQLAVNEIFGPTIQGEGSRAGQSRVFLRLSGCSLRCDFCDTKYAWKMDPAKDFTDIHDVRTALFDCGVQDTGGLVITGGEPLQQQGALAALVSLPGLSKLNMEMETNGHIMPGRDLADMVDWWAVSPKWKVPGGLEMEVLEYFAGLFNADFKLVVDGTPADCDFVDRLVAGLYLDPLRVWIQPQGTDADELLILARGLAPWALQRGYNLSLRLHVLLWGNERGR
jgi:7-carboxy-7-deazaguanine synthase